MNLEIIHKEHTIIGRPIALDAYSDSTKDVNVHDTSSSKSKILIHPTTTSMSRKRMLFGIEMPKVDNEISTILMPIKSLNPYQTRWHIKARVTTKKDMHQYVRDNKPGKVFNFDVIDNEGTITQISYFR